jgi:hypothetical protein
MRRIATATPRARSYARALALSAGALLLTARPAYAAGVHVPLVHAGILGDIFGGIGHAVLGAISWTFKLAAKFFLVTLGALVKLLIPRSWAQQGVQLMDWIVQVPNYAGTIASPDGHVYGFHGINELRELFTWLGIAIGPLTLVLATSRAIVSEREHPAAPFVRMVALAVLLISYPYWWAQGSALIDQITHAILALPAVTTGIHKLMLYAVDGVALGGWQLVDLGLMLAIGLALLALMFLKVVIILLGALLYATGPLMLGLVPLESGAAVTRAWCAAVGMLIVLPVIWASIFAVGALLIDDAGTAGPLLAGNTSIGRLVGGLLLAVAGLAALWACLRVAREAGALLRIQLGGMLAGLHALRAAPVHSGGATARGHTAARSLREFGQRVSRAGGAAGHALANSGPRGARLARAGGLAVTAGRRGLVGSAALAAGAGVRQLAGYTGGARAGVVAMQIARTGRGYKASAAAAGTASRSSQRSPTTSAAGSSPTAPRGSSRPAAADPAQTAPRTAASSAPPAAARIAPSPPAQSSPQAGGTPAGGNRPATQPGGRNRRRAARGARGGSDDPDAATARPERAVALVYLARVARGARRDRDPLRRGQALPARLPPHRHDHAARAHHTRDAAVGPVRAGARARALPARADPLPPLAPDVRLPPTG